MTSYKLFNALKAMTQVTEPPTPNERLQMALQASELETDKAEEFYRLMLTHAQGHASNKRALVYDASVIAANAVRFKLDDLPEELVHILYLHLQTL
jgi:hypothetical protein